MKESILYRTRQAWKLWAIYVGGAITILLVVATEWFSGSLPARYHALLMLTVVLLGLASFAFPCIAIKCPICGARWFWLAVSKKRISKGMRWLLAQSACPVCGTPCQKLMKENK